MKSVLMFTVFKCLLSKHLKGKQPNLVAHVTMISLFIHSFNGDLQVSVLMTEETWCEGGWQGFSLITTACSLFSSLLVRKVGPSVLHNFYVSFLRSMPRYISVCHILKFRDSVIATSCRLQMIKMSSVVQTIAAEDFTALLQLCIAVIHYL